MLAACGVQLPIGAPGAMPQTSTIAMHVERGRSWMLPEGKKIKKLLYVSDWATNDVFVYDYTERGDGREAHRLQPAVRTMRR